MVRRIIPNQISRCNTFVECRFTGFSISQHSFVLRRGINGLRIRFQETYPGKFDRWQRNSGRATGPGACRACCAVKPGWSRFSANEAAPAGLISTTATGPTVVSKISTALVSQQPARCTRGSSRFSARGVGSSPAGRENNTRHSHLSIRGPEVIRCVHVATNRKTALLG